MTWSYDPSKLATSDKDRMRLTLGDTDENDQLLQNEEIQYFLDSTGDFDRAAAKCCEAIAMKFKKEANTKVGPMTLELAKRAELWEEKAQDFLTRARAVAVPSVGGLSQAEKDDALANTDRTGPYFRTGMHDNANQAVPGQPSGKLYP